MIRFTDGPAAGVGLLLRRAPLYLRATKGASWDALDQLRDKPEPGELVTAYRRTGPPGWLHIDFTRQSAAWFAVADYVVVGEQPAERVLRSRHLWRAWCWAQVLGRPDREGGER